MKKILIIFNAHSYGGSELLMMRVCNYYKELNYEVTVFGDGAEDFLKKYSKYIFKFNIDNYYDFSIISGISINNLRFLKDYKIEVDKTFIWAFGENGFLENLMYGYGLRFRFSGKISLMYSFIYKVFFYKHYKRTISFVNYLILKKSLYFSQIDGFCSAVDSVNFDRTYSNLIIPIAVPSRGHYPEYQIDKSKMAQLSIGWIGRISFDFKVHSLIKAIDDAVLYCITNNIALKFIVIGNGDAVSYLLNRYENAIDFIFTYKGFMNSDDATHEIVENVDIMIGMGTAALDAASVGLPSIVLNASKTIKSSRNIRYRWLFDSVGWSTGEFIEFGNAEKQIGSELSTLLDQYFSDGDVIIKKNNSYIKNFEEKNVLCRINKSLEKSELSFSDLNIKYKDINIFYNFFIN